MSSDHDDNSFKAYFATHPWLAIPFAKVQEAGLGQKFAVRGIPALVVLKADGTVISANGRGDVMSKKAGAFDHWASQ